MKFALALSVCYITGCSGHSALRANPHAQIAAPSVVEAAQVHQHKQQQWPQGFAASVSTVETLDMHPMTSAFVVSTGSVILLAVSIAACLWRDVARESKHFAEPIKSSDEALQRALSSTPGQSKESLSNSKERPATLLGDCIGALMGFTVELVNCITIGLILQGGWPKRYLDVLFRHAAYGFMATQLFTTLISGFPGVLAPVGFECLGVVLVVRKIVVDEMADSSAEEQVMTFLACSTIVTFISAALLALMVMPQCSRILNMFPNCLRIGVFAATGFGIFMLGFMAFQLEPTSLASWTEWGNVMKWLPAYFLGLTLWFFDQYYWNKWLFLIFVIVVSGGVHSVLAARGTSLADAADEGWLLGSVPGSHFYEYYFFLQQGFGSVDWGVVYGCADRLLAAAFVGPMLNVAINILLLESLYKTNCNYSREFLAQSAGAVAAGLCLGWNSYLAVGDTNTLRQAGGKTSRAVAILISMLALVCVVPPFLPAITSVVPTHLIASMCVYGGFWMMKGCLIDNYTCFSTKEYAFVAFTAALCVKFTILDGLKFGFLAMTLLFMARGANDNYLKYLLSLRECRSIRSYAPNAEKWLQSHGSDVVVAAIDIQLISVFSDPAHIWRQIQSRVTTSSAVGLLVDFAGVQRLDATSIQTFVKMLTNIAPCSVLLANIPNSDMNEHAVLQRNLEEQEVDATLFMDQDICEEQRSKDALVCAEQILISKMPSRHQTLMPLLGLQSLDPSRWPARARCMAKIKVMHSVLQLYFPGETGVGQNGPSDFASSLNKRSFYHFALRGLCSFSRLQCGDTLICEGDQVQGLYVLAGGMILAKEGGDNVAEHAVMGELLGASVLHSSSSMHFVASSKALVMYIDLRSMHEEASLNPDAVLVLQRLLQEVGRLQEAKMARRIRLLTNHATGATGSVPS